MDKRRFSFNPNFEIWFWAVRITQFGFIRVFVQLGGIYSGPHVQMHTYIGGWIRTYSRVCSPLLL